MKQQEQDIAELKEALNQTVQMAEDHASMMKSDLITAKKNYEAKNAELKVLLKETVQMAEKFAKQADSQPRQRAFPLRDIRQLLLILGVVILAMWLNAKWRAEQEIGR